MPDAQVIRLGHYRTIYAIWCDGGVAVFMATYRHRQAPSEAHHRVLTTAVDARSYALNLADRFDCRIVGSSIWAGIEDVA